MTDKLHGDNFDVTNHMSCPKCRFEVLYLDAVNQTCSYVFQDGEIDQSTIEDEFDEIIWEEHGLISCNRVGCNWVKN